MLRRTLLSTFAALMLATPSFADDPLRIGVEGAYRPFSFKEADGKLAGFDIDIAMALCAQMKRDCELRIPTHSVGCSDNIRSVIPGYPVT